MKFSVLLLFSVVVLIKSVTSQTTCPEGIDIPIYGIGLIGASMLIMLLVIIYLIYALLKAKSHQYKVMTDGNQPSIVLPMPEQSSHDIYNRQESMEVPILSTSSPIDEIVIEDSFFKNMSSRDLQMNVSSATSSENRETQRSKIMPIIKKSVFQNFILPEDKMREICIGVLQNRKSIKDLNEFVNAIERRGSKTGLKRDKSASTPCELDLVADMPSTQGSINNAFDNKDTNEDRNEKVKDTKEKILTNIDDKENNNEPKEEIYDCPPLPVAMPTHSDEEDGDDEHKEEIYDCPPLPLPMPLENDNIDSNDEQEDEIYDCPPVPKEFSEDSNDTDVKIAQADEIYDSSPVASTPKKFVIDDTDYLMVIDQTIEGIREPSYINAKCNEFVL